MNILHDTVIQRVTSASRLIREYEPENEAGARLQAEAERLVETLLACLAVLNSQQEYVTSLVMENTNLHTHAMTLLETDLAIEKRRNCVALGVAGTVSTT